MIQLPEWFTDSCRRAYERGDLFTMALILTVILVLASATLLAVVLAVRANPVAGSKVLGTIACTMTLVYVVYRWIKRVGETEYAKRRLQERAGYGQP